MSVIAETVAQEKSITRLVDVKHHVLKTVSAESLADYRNGAQYQILRKDPILRDNYISFTALDWNSMENCLYVGLTAFDCDLLWKFHPDTAQFESQGFKRVAHDPQYVKIHRGLKPDHAGGYYFGTAGMVDLDERNDTRGGAIYHYENNHYEFCGIPLERDYVQHIEVDLKRQRAYGVTWRVMNFFDYDLRNRETVYSFFTGSHFAESVVDDEGYLWGTWAANRGHCLFRYHPDIRKPEFFYDPIPNLDPNHMFTFPMNGPIDSFINGGDGYLYFGTTLGELYQLDPKTAKHTLLGKPTEYIRLSGLRIGPGANLLGSYGVYNDTGLFLYDRQSGEFTNLGAMRDGENACFMIHDIAWDGGSRVFAAETDTVDRSSYLWEATLV
jgi:hypothetical protein